MNATVTMKTGFPKTAVKPATALSRPEDRPLADVVLYDSHCRMCTNQVRRLARWDGGGRLAFLPLDDPQVAQRWPELQYDDLMREMHLVERAGGIHRGAGAFRYLTRHIPRLYVLAPLLHLPGSLGIWSWLYRQVANRRYQLFGRVECDGGTCQLHH